MRRVSLEREDKGGAGLGVSLKIPLPPKSLLNPRWCLCQGRMLEGPSAILSGHHEGLRDGKAECGRADSGGGSVSGGGAAEIPG